MDDRGGRETRLEVFNQAPTQDSDFIGDGVRMKNKNNKTGINRRRPGGILEHLECRGGDRGE